MAEMRVIYGPDRSSRIQDINVLMSGNWNDSLLIVPTRLYALRRTEDILLDFGLDGSWDKHVLTFPDFVSLLLKKQGIEQKLINEMERRLLRPLALRL